MAKQSGREAGEGVVHSHTRRESRAPRRRGEKRCPVTEVAEAEGQGQDLGCEVQSTVDTLGSAVQVGICSG